MSFTIGTATFTNGSRDVTNVSLTSGKTSYFSRGTRVVVGANPVLAEVEATNAPTNSTFTLAQPWPHATGSYAFLANMTSEGVRDAVQNIRDYVGLVQDVLNSVDVNPTANSVAKRDASGRVKVANAVDANDAVAFNQVSQLQTELAEANQNLVAISSSASTLANIYQDTASGLAATTDGQFFSVAGSGDVFVTLYYNDNGTAVAREVLPSKASVDSVATQINVTKILALAGVVLP